MAFMALIVFFLWRTMKLMPKTKPQEIKPDSAGSIKWDEVAGADEAKAELQEVVDFLRDPQRFRELGAKVPKGILLHGPPGTGKTLLAKAVANESGAQFFAQSAASFVEMFAGLGAARIRRLFGEARKHSPAIIFIDEIDAVAARRGSDNNSEREQTLNQLLVEMDGFSSSGEIVVIAASNLLDKLDPALLRPGRFDRQILVSPPDVGGREAILKVHTRNKPVGDIDFEIIARQTAGLTGADLANIANEAAIAAARGRRSKLEQADFENALERVVAGMQSRRVLTEHERRVIAFHEAGHALCSELLPGRRPHAQGLDRPARQGARLHAALPGRGPLPQDAGRADGPDDGPARRPRRGGDDLRRHHDRRLRRPQAGRVDLALDDPRVGDGHVGQRDPARRPRAAPSPTARASCATPSSSTSPTRRCAARVRLLNDHRAQLDQLAVALLRQEVLEREDIERIMEGVPTPRHVSAGHLRVAAAEPTDVQKGS